MKEAHFDSVVVDGVEYFDSKEKLTHQAALDLAAKHGLRVLESWEMHKLWCESEEFRESVMDKYFWCASVYSDVRNFAWQFSGYFGYVSNSGPRFYLNGVRAVVRGE